MRQAQRGFTLIELVMVIVILGVLAAVAIPKFVDLKADAQTAAAQGVAGALSSGSAINYSVYVLKGTSGTGAASAITTCEATKNTLQGAAYPSGGGTYSSTTTTLATPAAGSVNSCVLTFAPTSGSSVTAAFTTIAAP